MSDIEASAEILSSGKSITDFSRIDIEDSFQTGDLRIIAEKKAKAVIEKLKNQSLTLALAESCTAGLVSSLLANTSGASAVLWGSFVCYTQEAKVQMLDLDNKALLTDGLVSRQTAESMAKGALGKSGADIAAAVTGLAGPAGDGRVPVGTVWVATARRGGEIEAKKYFFTSEPDNPEAGRNTIRYCAVVAVLESVLRGLT